MVREGSQVRGIENTGLSLSASGSLIDVPRHALELSELRIYARNRSSIDRIALFLPVIVGASLTQWFGLLEVSVYIIIILAASSLHSYLCRRFISKVIDPSPEEIRRWFYIIAGTRVFYSTLFSSIAYVFWIPGAVENHIMIMTALVFTEGAITAQSTSHHAISIANLIPVGAALVIPPLQEGGALYGTLAMLMTFYILYFAKLGMKSAETSNLLISLYNTNKALVSELEEANQESQEARRQAENANHAKSAFLAKMSHEIRTPLNTILGFAEILAATDPKERTAARQTEYAASIQESGLHLMRLINDILDLSRIEAGRFELNEEKVDIRDVTSSCLRTLTVLADAKSLTLSVNSDPHLPPLWADERALRQIMFNLLSNAIKFTPENGEIRIGHHLIETGALALSVSDTGVGIAAVDIPKVMETFGQARHNLNVMQKGSGLGLPIVKGLCDVHGASFDIASTKGIGTTISITFPPARVRPPSQVSVHEDVA